MKVLVPIIAPNALSGDVSILARDRYQDLRSAGPNDGLTLITDGLMPGCMTVAQLGVDHFFLDPEMNLKTAAMVRMVIKLLKMESRHRICHPLQRMLDH